MKKLLLLLVACLFIFCGCSTDGDLLAYQRGEIFVSVDFKIDGKLYGADLFLSEEDENNDRDAAILFSYPDNLNGVSVKRVGKSSYLSLDGIEIPLLPAALSGFFDVTDAFSIDGTLESVAADKETNMLKISSSAGVYTVTLDVKSRVPRSILAEVGGRTIDITIKKFVKS